MTVNDPVLTPSQVTEQTGIAQKTLANWRSLAQGPAFFKIGRLVRYRQSAVDAWIDAHNPQSNVTHIGARRSA